jgi:simple sugar transport system ATP-binding protein
MTDPLIKMVNINKSFDGVIALDGANFETGCNEVVGLIGDNGAGKSTLIKVLMGVYRPNKGTIYFKGKKMENWSVEIARKSGIEPVYQERALVDKQCLWKNIFMGREITNRLGFLKLKESREKTENLMRKLMGFTAKSITPESIVKNMSGGEKQGIAIARALYYQAELIILDEPTTALSISETKKVLNFIKKIKEQGKSAIVISHTIYQIFPVVDRFVIIDRGRIVGEFKREEVSMDELEEKLYDVAHTGHLS